MVRFRTFSWYAPFLISLIASSAGHLAWAQDATPSSATAFLTAYETGGLPVDLDVSQLKVEVAGKPARILSLSSAKGSKFVFALAVDVGGSEARNAGPIREAAGQLFRALSKRGGSGYLVLFNQGIAASKAPLTPDAAQADLDGVRFYGGTALYDAVDKTCTRILSRSNNSGVERRVLVLLSDGDDDQSHVGSDKALRDAVSEGVSVYSMAVKEVGRKGIDFLGMSARYTGGVAFIPRTVAVGWGPLLAGIDDQWVLRVETAEKGTRAVESLKIRTGQKGVILSVPAKILIP